MSPQNSSPPKLTLRAALPTWAKVAALSFGGPAGQIAVMHRLVVEEEQWISDEQFSHALSYCMLLPGPEAQQLATYIGWLKNGVAGGILAGTLFVLPGVFAILALSLLYVYCRDVSLVAGLFFGLRPAVLAIVIDAIKRMATKVLKTPGSRLLAGLALAALYLFKTPFPAIICTAGAIGALGNRFWPTWFAGPSPSQSMSPAAPTHAPLKGAFIWRHILKVTFWCLLIWWGPLLIVGVLFGWDSVWFQQGLFFSKAAVVTFGGAYSVLSYVAQQAVENFHWVRPDEMLTGLSMAETTPGPLIMVVQFVGFVGAFQQPGVLAPLVAGLIGAGITTWCTFAPCFYWIFLGAPFIEGLRENRTLNSALKGISAAVVGVIANLALWFAVHALFRDVQQVHAGILHADFPVLTTLDWRASLIALAAGYCLLIARQGITLTLAVGCVLGILLYPK